jgi:hypothetical protein
VDSRGRVPGDVGKVYLIAEYSLRVDHIIATRTVEFCFGLTNGFVGPVIRIDSKWKWNGDL